MKQREIKTSVKYTDQELFDIKTASSVYRQANALIRQGNLLLEKNKLGLSSIDEFASKNRHNQLETMLRVGSHF